MKTKLLGKSSEQLAAIAADCGLKPFVGRQIAEWLYVKRVSDWDRMTNVSKDSKARLQECCDLGTSAPAGGRKNAAGNGRTG